MGLRGHLLLGDEELALLEGLDSFVVLAGVFYFDLDALDIRPMLRELPSRINQKIRNLDHAPRLVRVEALEKEKDPVLDLACPSSEDPVWLAFYFSNDVGLG